MNDDLKIINKLFKPYKYTIKGKTKILSCADKDYVIKPKCHDLESTYRYLSSRGFDYYVPLVDSNRDNYDVFPYVYDNNVPYEQKGSDLARITSLLHAKTSYNKKVDASTYDNIYHDILNNCEYLEDYYSKMYDDMFLFKYHKPHEIMFLDFYSKINNAIGFCKKELESWYQIVSDKTDQRVSLIHNNLKVEHLLSDDKDYLISFDKAKIDTPVLDLVNLYKNEYDNLEFSEVFKTYLYHFNLNEDEQKLFFILISLPEEITFSSNNFDNVKKIYNLNNYINKTEKLMRPYYFTEEEEK